MQSARQRTNVGLANAYGKIDRMRVFAEQGLAEESISASPVNIWKRMGQMGVQLAESMTRRGQDPVEAAAIRVLAGTPYFLHSQRELKSMARRRAPGREKAPLVDYACGFNNWIMRLGRNDPRMRVASLLDAMGSAHELVNPSDRNADTEDLLDNVVYGVQQEMAGIDTVRQSGNAVGLTTHAQDLGGADGVMQYPNDPQYGILFDWKGSPEGVRAKCGDKDLVEWGTHDGVVVMWTGLGRRSGRFVVGETLGLDEGFAVEVYNEYTKPIIDEVLDLPHPRVERVPWEE